MEPSPCPKCEGPRRMRSNGSFGGKPRTKPFCPTCETIRLRRHPAVAAGKKRWKDANREKYLAHKAVENALKAGKLTRQPCECGCDRKAQAHHEDYSKPLEVRWLCDEAHKARHREMRQAA